MTNPTPRKIPFSCAGRKLEARAVRMSTNWEIWIFENNRKLARYTLVHRQTVEDAERYGLDLIGNEMCAMIKAIESGAWLLTVVNGPSQRGWQR